MIALDLSLLFDVLFCLPFCWCPCMAINVSVQYDGGFLSDIILLTQCYYHRGTRLNAMKRGSTIGEGGDTMILSPGRSPKQPLPGIGLHDPLHGRQACPEFIAFDQGVGQICPR